MKKIEPLSNQATGGDKLHWVVRSGLGVVPIAGGILAESFDIVVTAPAEKRQSIWLATLAKTINDVIDHVDGLTTERLAEDQAFQEVIVKLSRTAIDTTRVEKLELLRNIVWQAASGLELSEFLRVTFLRLIDVYTVEHLMMLTVLNDETKLTLIALQARIDLGKTDKEEIMIEDVSSFLLEGVEGQIAREMFRDLHRDGLCYGSEGFAHMIDPRQPSRRTTVRGQQFLKFVAAPNFTS